VKDNADRRTTANTGTRRTPLAEEGGTGSPANAGGSADKHDRPVATSAKTHRVVEGETFSSIARATYGDAKYFKDIIKANPNIDPNRLRPGTVISLPDKSQFKHDAAPTTGSASPEQPRRHSPPSTSTNPKTEYRVQANDNLYKISEKLYHTANRVDAIYQLNKSVIGPDPEKLKLDMVLKLPEPPTETASR
jgi:nucleoid-associated protein YgaU